MRSRRRLKSDSLEVPERLLSRIKYRSTSTAYKVDNNRNKIDLCTICKHPRYEKSKIGKGKWVFVVLQTILPLTGPEVYGLTVSREARTGTAYWMPYRL